MTRASGSALPRVLAVNHPAQYVAKTLGGLAEIRSAHESADADVPISYRPGSFPDMPSILAALETDGWRPEFILAMFPEFFPMPDGLFETGIPVSAFVSDWHLAYSRILGHLALYDCVLIDPVGTRAMSRRGLTNCVPVPIYWTDKDFLLEDEGAPAVGSNDICRRPVDIGFVGNLAREVQFERAPWMNRLTDLARRGPTVRIGHNIRGPDYARFLRECKIGFNRTIRSEFNMRCYEVLASGSVLMVERGNADVEERLEDGREYVSYDESDFEETVLGLLREPERLASIAANGHAYFLALDYRETHARVMMDAITATEARSGRELSRDEHAAVIDQQNFKEGVTYFPESIPPSPATATLTTTIGPGDARLANALGSRIGRSILYTALMADGDPGPDVASWSEVVLHLFELASLDSLWVVPRMNAVAFLGSRGRNDEAIARAHEVLGIVQNCTDASLLEGTLVAASYGYEVEYLLREKVLARYGLIPTDAYREQLAAVTKGIVWLYIGQAHQVMGRMADAVAAFEAADVSFPTDIVVAKAKIVLALYPELRQLLMPGRHVTPETAVIAATCIRAAEGILTPSVLAMDDGLTMLFHLYVAMGQYDDARLLAQRYLDATSCVVGEGYLPAICDAWRVIVETARIYGHSEVLPPDFASSSLASEMVRRAASTDSS